MPDVEMRFKTATETYLVLYKDGSVEIDWPKIREVAAANELKESTAWARIWVAIVDGNWRNLA